MAVLEFPPVEEADDTGLLAFGGDLDVHSLVLAYRSGIFLWPFDPRLLAWFAPPRRAVLFFDEFHLSASLQRLERRSTWSFKMNTAFREVISNCAQSRNRKKGQGSWITPKMVDAYTALHQAGHAHSFECYDRSELIGGVYGVSIGHFFAAESMFYLAPNASKLALCFMVRTLGALGLKWIDLQVLNPFTSGLGGREIERDEFQIMLAEACKQPSLRLCASTLGK